MDRHDDENELFPVQADMLDKKIDLKTQRKRYIYESQKHRQN